MRLGRLLVHVRRWRHPVAEDLARRPRPPGHDLRTPIDHVIILDGTLAGLRDHAFSSAGLFYRLLARNGLRANRVIYYEEGQQWTGWRHLPGLLTGSGVGGQIADAYAHLASRYRPGDRVFLFGYSRGAFAVRSLAGMIHRVGLLREKAATQRNIRMVWRHYRLGPERRAARVFAAARCHDHVPIRMIGVWDTVKALGVRLPLLWMLSEARYAFHDAKLSDNVQNGFQALALDETRAAFRPLVWHTNDDTHTRVEQVWFRGAHSDIGGQIGDFTAARPLANIPLVWMLDRAEGCGLDLPAGWREEFPCDPLAPAVGTWRGFGALFLLRARRHPGGDASERLHESVPEAARRQWRARFGAREAEK